MKFTALFLLGAALQVSAIGHTQTVSINVKNATLKKVFNAIEKQAGYTFIYTEDLLTKGEPVTIDIKNGTVEQALALCFKGQPLSYSIIEKVVVVKPLPTTVVEPAKTSLITIPPLIDIRGRVVNENGEPVRATVTVKGTNKATSTNDNGEFVLANVDERAVLVISGINLERVVEISVNGKADVGTIVTKTKISELNAIVINKGFYSTSNKLNTGSVGTIKAAEISKQPVSDPLMALEGRISGLYISQPSGVPGAILTVNIRGLNSIANGTSPLYIVDGIPFNSQSLSIVPNAAGYQALSPFTSIRPADIESIDVLKDADATSIYGSRGANGVILITTKKGKAGKTKLDVNIYQGTGRVTKMLDLMNTEQYLQMRNEVFKNDASAPGTSDYDLKSKRYTDWQKLLIGGTSRITDAKATLSGGSAQTQFLIGFGYRKETTVFPGDFSNQIASVNLSLNHESENKRFRTSFSASYSNNNNNLPQLDFTNSIFLPPNAPALYDSLGKLNFENGTFNNPYTGLLKDVTAVNNALISNLDLNYKLIDNLNIQVKLGYNITRSKEVNLIPISSYSPTSIFSPADQRYNFTGINSYNTWTIEPQLNYSKLFGGHRIDFLTGATFQENLLDGVSITASGFSSDALLNDLGQATSQSFSIRYSQYRYNALFARLGYSYNEKYVLNLTARRDGSSRFGPGRKFGNFGSVGAGWIFSKENWVAQHLGFMSYGKLRASLGKTGNDQTGDYRYLSSYSANQGYFGSSALRPTALANDQFGWETINKIEAALELGFLKDRIVFTTAFYRNRTRDQLVGYPLPDITGFPTVVANLPAVIQNKGFEFDITATAIQTKNFSWTTTANISIPKNKLLSFPNIAGSSYATTYAVGQPITTKFVYKYTGIDPVKGVYKFEDFNQNGQNDVTDRYFIFSGQRYFGGLNNAFNYKSISLSFFVQFVNQTGYRLVPPSSPGRVGQNMPAIYFDRWQKPGDQPQYQKYSVNFVTNNAFTAFMQSDAAIVDASFIRMKNVSLSWQVPSKSLQHLKIKNALLYIQCQNLFTITKYEGLDPETQSSNGYPTLPTLRMLTIGAQISL